MGKEEYFKKRDAIIEEYKAAGRRKEIQDVLKKLTWEQRAMTIPEDLCFLYGTYLEDYLSYDLNARKRQKQNAWIAERTHDIPVLSQVYTSLLSVPTKYISGVPAMLDAMGQKVVNWISGKEKPVDYNRDASALSHMVDSVRSEVTQTIDEATGTKWVGGIYNTGMSMLDSTVSAAATAINPVAGTVAQSLLSTSAAADTMRSAAQSGASDNQAIMLGVAAGFFEWFFEKYEIESLLKQGGGFV